MSTSTSRQYCTFYLEGLLFGIESQPFRRSSASWI
jgi:hypothetical protein